MGPYPIANGEALNAIVLCDYPSARCQDGAFEDDGEATIWFEPPHCLKQQCSDEDNYRYI